jgi:CRISPR-associated endonuclease/helicase Cas3
MNVLLVSRCTHRAATESRRILDQFAERRGDGVWQTAITRAGLDALRRLLRKTARKNTAVACHWIRGRDHSELLWIAGNAARFNEQGAVPTHATRADVLRAGDENTWHNLRVILLVAGMAALWHDMGKACRAFQEMLRSSGRSRRRHEWISLRLFQAFVGKDDDAGWLSRLANLQEAGDAAWPEPEADAAPRPLELLPPLARAAGWLIVSHHRLPVERGDVNHLLLDKQPESVASSWINPIPEPGASLEGYEAFPLGLPLGAIRWRERAARLARELLQRAPSGRAFLDDPHAMHLARLIVMLADHAYSSRENPPGANPDGLFANTTRERRLNQTLDEHLAGVEKYSRTVSRFLQRLGRDLPRLRHKGLSRRSGAGPFHWQDAAAECAVALRERSRVQGAFIVNMASTGCGKTLANARIMHALSEPLGMRCAFALGLRTLTRQTGREYRERLRLDEDEAAVLVGGAASAELYERFYEEAESAGAASAQSLLPEEIHVSYEGNPDADPILSHIVRDPRARRLLLAPMLCCTIDHLVPATEGVKGGRHLVPTLRLLTGDLVLDELDDYDMADLPAITRLVFWAGLWGSRVLISSATLPPALARGMFEAYRQGRAHFQRNRGERPAESPPICCLWTDENKSVARDCANREAFAEGHADFVEKRCHKLLKAAACRQAEICHFPVVAASDRVPAFFAEYILACARALHERHSVADPHGNRRVSFGLARMANIAPLFATARALFLRTIPAGFHIHLCVYHSQFPLLTRSAIEARLDRAMKRHRPEAVFDLPEIRAILDARGDVREHVFLVLASPIAEVGRDHDYDWAVVEPSSMRSIIQLAGRIRRHRPTAPAAPNIMLFERNVKALQTPGGPAYQRPGFETNELRFADHSLDALLEDGEYRVITSLPRIRPRQELRPHDRLADLEHFRLEAAMRSARAPEERSRRGRAAPDLNALSCCRPRAMLSGLLQKEQPFRKNRPDVDLVLLPNEDGDDFRLVRLWEPRTKGTPARPVDVEKSHNHRVDLPENPGISPWGAVNYMSALLNLADGLEMDVEQCARRYGVITLPDSTYGWMFHPFLGFTEKR